MIIIIIFTFIFMRVISVQVYSLAMLLYSLDIVLVIFLVAVTNAWREAV